MAPGASLPTGQGQPCAKPAWLWVPRWVQGTRGAQALLGAGGRTTKASQSHLCASVSPFLAQTGARSLGASFLGFDGSRLFFGPVVTWEGPCPPLPPGSGRAGGAIAGMRGWEGRARGGHPGLLGPSAVGRSAAQTQPWSCRGCCWRWLGCAQPPAWVNPRGGHGGCGVASPWVSVLGMGHGAVCGFGGALGGCHPAGVTPAQPRTGVPVPPAHGRAPSPAALRAPRAPRGPAGEGDGHHLRAGETLLRLPPARQRLRRRLAGGGFRQR